MAARIPAKPAPTTTTSCRTINASEFRAVRRLQTTKPNRAAALGTAAARPLLQARHKRRQMMIVGVS
jgi:hypothetical protein